MNHKKTVNKGILIDIMQKKSGKQKKILEECLDVALETIKEEVSNGNKVQLRGFGSFDVSRWKARNKLNPKTGETFFVAAHNDIKFSGSEDFKLRVNLQEDKGNVLWL